jgi:hypothetical protein
MTKTELCGISGEPLDECVGTHEDECVWRCDECGGNSYNCICPNEDDTVYCSDCGEKEAYANGLCADCLPHIPYSPFVITKGD